MMFGKRNLMTLDLRTIWRHITRLAVVLATMQLFAAGLAWSASGTVDKGRREPLSIAIAPFGSDEISSMIAGVIANDLGHSGYFAPMDPGSYPEQLNYDSQPGFPNWQQLGARALVVGQVVPEGAKIRVIFKLYDVNAGQLLIEPEPEIALPKNARRLAHRVADQIYKAMTGYDGYFDTQVVFVDETGGKGDRVKKLAIMDQDGYGAQQLSVSGNLLLTPRFNPVANEVTYMSYDTGTPRVFIYNIGTKQREIVGDFQNMSFAPRFSPDGNTIIMSLQSDDGNYSNIVEMNLQSRQTRQVTQGTSINTAPSYSPNGSQIAFESDRGGTQQIYVMGSDGSNPQRISFGKGRYSTPVWSPDGTWIAFTKNNAGKFAIGVMKPDGSAERILTEGFHNEGPTWAPNSHVLMFFRESGGEAGGAQLFSVDVSGYNEQRIPTPNFGSDPAWGPRRN
jgi:TolB protein